MNQETAASSPDAGQTPHSLPSINQNAAEQYRQGPPSYDLQSRSSQPNQSSQSDQSRQLSQVLALLSIGLGVAQLLAPRKMSRAIGIQEHPGLLMAIGAREIASGVGILSQQHNPSPWLWSRVAGDAMDLAMLGAAARSGRNDHRQRKRLAFAAAAVAGIAVFDLLSSMKNSGGQHQQQAASDSRTKPVEKSITINKSPEECYRFWHDFSSFPRFMKHIESVQMTGNNRMHWKAKGPLGTSVEWDAEVSADEPNQYIAWRSLEDSEVDNAGMVRFERAPGGRGTIVRVNMQYSPPGGMAGAVAAKLSGEEPAQQIDEDLRHFKWLIETGEIPTTVGQPSGPRGAFNRLLFRKGAPG